jgi:hypothetical protein
MAEIDYEQVNQHVQALLQSGQVDEARELVRRLLMRNPNDADAWRIMARLVDSPERAADCYEQILRINPADEAARAELERLRAGPSEADFTPLLRDALLLLQRDRRAEAIELVEEILRRDPDNIQAWGVMARLVSTPEEVINCLEQILRIEPENEAVQEQLARIRDAMTHDEEEARQASAVLPYVILLIIMMVLALIVVIFGLPLLRSGGAPAPEATLPPTQGASRPAGSQEVTCETLLERAMHRAAACRQIQPGQVCYGNEPLIVELAPETTYAFQTSGDVIPEGQLRSVEAGPLDLNAENWGLVLLALPVALPAAIPDVGITLTLFGGARLESDGQGFTFSSAPDAIPCDLVPYPGLLVNAASSRGASFRLNGAEITALGAMYFRAEPGAAMTVSVLDGTGAVEAGGASQEVGPGEEVTVPLGGGDGLQAAGPPGAPAASDFVLAGTSCQLLGVGCTRTSAGGAEPPTETPSPTTSPQTPETPPTEEQGTALPTATLTPTVTAFPTSTTRPTNTAQPTSAPPTRTYTPTATPSRTPTTTPTFTEIPPAFPLQPSGVIATGQPTFVWVQAGSITQYLLNVRGDGGFDEEWWGAASCSGGECSIPSPWTLAADTYHWRIMPAGGTTWSITRDFTVSP